jgi:hypothetical protein
MFNANYIAIAMQCRENCPEMYIIAVEMHYPGFEMELIHFVFYDRKTTGHRYAIGLRCQYALLAAKLLLWWRASFDWSRDGGGEKQSGDAGFHTMFILHISVYHI